MTERSRPATARASGPVARAGARRAANAGARRRADAWTRQAGARVARLAPAGTLAAAALMALLLAAVAGASGAGWFAGPARTLADARFALAARAPVLPTVLVAIDAASLRAIDVWPWPRRRHAELIDELAAAGAAEIHLDIDFSSPSNAADDEALADALARSPVPVTLAGHAQATPGGLAERLPWPAFAAHADVASVVVRAGGDGLVRRAERGRLLGGVPTPSLASLLAGRPAAPGHFAIDFSIDPDAVPVIPFVDVLEGRAERSAIEGARVVVGATAVELGDMLAVPRHGVLPGALVQVLAAETLAQGRVPAPVPHALAAGLAVALALGLALLAGAARGRVPLFVGLGAILAAWAVLGVADAYAFAVNARTMPTPELALALVAIGVCLTLHELVRRRARALAEARRAADAAHMLARVVADNFDGILVFDEGGAVLSASAVARHQMRELFGVRDGTDGMDDLPADLRAVLMRPAALLRAGRWEVRGPRMHALHDRFGRTRHVEYVLTPSWTAPAEGGPPGVMTTLTMRDVSEQLAARTRMDWLARHDEPTGALKPHALGALIDAAGVSTHGNGGDEGARGTLVAFDLTRFAVVRRTLGRGRADDVLARVVERVAALPAARAVARTGDDEFVAWLASGDGEAPCDAAAAEAVRGAAREGLGATAAAARMAVPTGTFALGPAADGPDGADGAATSVDARAAIEAAVTAKEVAARRGDAVVRHAPAMNAEAARRLAIEADLPDAIASGALDVHYQPQIDLATGRTLGVEALARWTHPVLGIVPPDEFVAVAEAAGRIADLGAWVLERACADIKGLVGPCGPLRVGVNVSPQQFVQSDVGAMVGRALERTGLPPDRLELEITESLAVDDPATVGEALAPWRARGVRVALDDFGTGYAQLGALGALALDEIKLDRSLVAPLPSPHASSLVAAALTIARGHGLTTVAEGVEDERTAALLRGAGCHVGQGYHWSRPLPLVALGEWLRASAPAVAPPASARAGRG